MVYDEVEPNTTEWLDVGDGQRVYVETSGNPAGSPAVVLHGGPGSGQVAWLRRHLDPARYRVIALHQRQCGLSTPHAADPHTDLAVNTTPHLIADLELIRDHLDVQEWLLLGVSWGSTLALTYAQTYPDRVRAIVLAAVTMTRREDVDWLYHGVGAFLPEAWQRFAEGVPPADRADLIAGYYRLLGDPDAAVREQAARAWCEWEDAVTHPEGGHDTRYDDPLFRMAFARIVTHYFHHGAWLEPGQLLRDAGRLRGIPGVLVHGRLDIGGPPRTAWELAQVWPDAELHFVPRRPCRTAGDDQPGRRRHGQVRLTDAGGPLLGGARE